MDNHIKVFFDENGKLKTKRTDTIVTLCEHLYKRVHELESNNHQTK